MTGLAWWGYRHTNGGLHLKRYLNSQDLAGAFLSPFVEEVFGPFEADTKDEASLMLHQLAEDES